VSFRLILGDPKLAGELVDLLLERGHPELEFSKFCFSILAGGTGLVNRLGDDLLKCETVDNGVVFEAVPLQRGNLLLQVDQALDAFPLELLIPPLIPAVQQVGDVILEDFLAFIVQ